MSPAWAKKKAGSTGKAMGDQYHAIVINRQQDTERWQAFQRAWDPVPCLRYERMEACVPATTHTNWNQTKTARRRATNRSFYQALVLALERAHDPVLVMEDDTEPLASDPAYTNQALSGLLAYLKQNPEQWDVVKPSLATPLFPPSQVGKILEETARLPVDYPPERLFERYQDPADPSPNFREHTHISLLLAQNITSAEFLILRPALARSIVDNWDQHFLDMDQLVRESGRLFTTFPSLVIQGRHPSTLGAYNPRAHYDQVEKNNHVLSLTFPPAGFLAPRIPAQFIVRQAEDILQVLPDEWMHQVCPLLSSKKIIYFWACTGSGVLYPRYFDTGPLTALYRLFSLLYRRWGCYKHTIWCPYAPHRHPTLRKDLEAAKSSVLVVSGSARGLIDETLWGPEEIEPCSPGYDWLQLHKDILKPTGKLYCPQLIPLLNTLTDTNIIITH